MHLEECKYTKKKIKKNEMTSFVDKELKLDFSDKSNDSNSDYVNWNY